MTERSAEVVDQNSVSWNQFLPWLRQLDTLRVRERSLVSPAVLGASGGCAWELPTPSATPR
jgi:hypothetical protein